MATPLIISSGCTKVQTYSLKTRYQSCETACVSQCIAGVGGTAAWMLWGGVHCRSGEGQHIEYIMSFNVNQHLLFIFSPGL